ncbi:hypothetical protein FA13DRAFT_1824618 [Coprinellus micaceus]|uniref:F-box domain-containing protein n=1 Tax=Coprinellus micaceus TaxID=71717 RepID=A0A4Y7RBE9_COPMI|nr:hypothetical protein FA13DRAFT_1824618 [Coprinellus micaceus]
MDGRNPVVTSPTADELDGPNGSTAPQSIQTLHESQPQAYIHSLPPEILGHIFFHLHTHTSTATFASRTPGELLRATHVCQYWRQIALYTPDLWTHIQVRHLNDPCAIASFFRSGCLPLHVDLVYYESKESEGPHSSSAHGALKLLLANLHRIEALSVHTTSLGWVVPEFAYANVLKRLHISTSNPGQGLPIKLFSDSFPPIEELTLSNYSSLPPCNSLQLHSLRRLSFYTPETPSGESLHFLDYLPLISASPQLEHLLISRSGSRSPLNLSSGNLHSLSMSGTPTPLPNLRTLTLRSTTPNIDDIIHFLSCVQIPDTASRYLFTSSWSDWPGGSLTNLINQAQSMGNSAITDGYAPHPIRELQIVSSKTIEGQKAFGLEDGTATFTANLSWAVRNAFLSSGLLSEVEDLVCVDLPGYYSTAELIPLFTALPSLRRLTVLDNASSSSIIGRVCDALRPRPILTPNSRRGLDRCERWFTLPCILLESIRLGSDNPLPKNRRTGISEMRGVDLSKLEQLAEERTQRGAPLKYESGEEESVVCIRQHVETVPTSQEDRTQDGQQWHILKDAFERMRQRA